MCGFVPMHPCQLDIDHIDGCHSNNDHDNLQTLCANCHRLKTHMNGDTLTPGSAQDASSDLYMGYRENIELDLAPGAGAFL